MTNISKGKRSSPKLKSRGDHDEFLSRITKSLYYSRLPMTDRLSLPVTELAAELFTEVKGGLTLERLDAEEAGRISRNACVSPCSLVLALLYVERLKDCNPEYLRRVAPSELFLVSLMVASKFLNDDGEDDEVFNAEWAKSGDSTVDRLNRLEKEFLRAIDWTIFVRNADFWERLRRLEKDVAYREARKRGWFSYAELYRLIDDVPLAAIVQTLLGVSSICLATYAAGLVTLLGSVLVASQLPGTSLVPRQNATRDDPTDRLTDLTQSATIDDFRFDETQTIRNETIPDLSSYDSSCENCRRSLQRENSTGNRQGWFRSVVNSLPIYSQISQPDFHQRPSKKHPIFRKFVTNNDPSFGRSLVTDNSFFTEENSRARETAENLATRINWRETFSSNFDRSSTDWRFYATKISFGHGR